VNQKFFYKCNFKKNVLGPPFSAKMQVAAKICGQAVKVRHFWRSDTGTHVLAAAGDSSVAERSHWMISGQPE